MGQAKQRGTFEQRQADAKVRIAAESKARQERIDTLKAERAALQARLVRERPAEAAKQKSWRGRNQVMFAIAAGLALNGGMQ